MNESTSYEKLCDSFEKAGWMVRDLQTRSERESSETTDGARRKRGWTSEKREREREMQAEREILFSGE